ncbi:hypothetical protein C8F04DRAFT_1182086 [Mycena alexandri]|uniref:Uncharacterized protein n=1 Tax=Mycena alexandri TaxID=1745969 RepID=A0AAD6SYJ5_9AGAR|nr:hypothetical protein C8F04DRAFT_1182086 [Mycena alexandri]
MVFDGVATPIAVQFILPEDCIAIAERGSVAGVHENVKAVEDPARAKGNDPVRVNPGYLGDPELRLLESQDQTISDDGGPAKPAATGSDEREKMEVWKHRRQLIRYTTRAAGRPGSASDADSGRIPPKSHRFKFEPSANQAAARSPCGRTEFIALKSFVTVQVDQMVKWARIPWRQTIKIEDASFLV